LALAISGALLWAFPTVWMALVLVLLMLLAAQATLVRRSLSVVRADAGAPGIRVSRTVDVVDATPAFANLSGTPAKPALDPAAFARFRAHLENVEKQRAGTPAAPAPAAPTAPAAAPAAPVTQAAAPAAPAAAPKPASVSGDDGVRVA